MKSAERHLVDTVREYPRTADAGKDSASVRGGIPGSKDSFPGAFSPRIGRALTKPIAQDVLIAGVLTALALIGVFARLKVDLPEGGGDVSLRGLDALGIGLILLQTLPLIWRRKAPVAVLSVITTALFLSSVLGYFRSFASFGFLVALYTVAAHRDRRVSIRVGIVSGIVIFMIVLLGKEPLEPDTMIAEALIVGAVWFIGDSMRLQRSHVVQLEDRTTRLEKERDALARKAVAQERRVIARELHDVVAHNVSVIVAQAGAAQRIFDAHPEEARTTLGAIEYMGRAALVEMRRLMGFLRTRTDGSVMRSPQPGLDNLETLVAQVRETGLPVTLRVEGSPRALPAGLDLSAFRIVQEALTNTLKHAGPARATVIVRYEKARVGLEIFDDGMGASSRRAGPPQTRYGHLGMRERVGLFGGELRVGGRPGGGFEVIASLPLDGEPS